MEILEPLRAVGQRNADLGHHFDGHWIERARIDARLAERPIRDGDVLTACQQACPTEAIVFGDLNDPKAKVTRLHQEERGYELLHELGTRPRTVYLARVMNPNPELA